jgi:hypothetical protein
MQPATLGFQLIWWTFFRACGRILTRAHLNRLHFCQCRLHSAVLCNVRQETRNSRDRKDRVP